MSAQIAEEGDAGARDLHFAAGIGHQGIFVITLATEVDLLAIVVTAGHPQIDLEQIVVEQTVVEAQIVGSQIVLEVAAGGAEIGDFKLGVRQEDDAVFQLQIAVPVVAVVIAAISTGAISLTTALGGPYIGTGGKTPVVSGHGTLAAQSQHKTGNQRLFHYVTSSCIHGKEHYFTRCSQNTQRQS